MLNLPSTGIVLHAGNLQEIELVGADFYSVTTDQLGRSDALSVEISAVATPQVAQSESLAVFDNLKVLARDRAIVNNDVRVFGATDHSAIIQ